MQNEKLDKVWNIIKEERTNLAENFRKTVTELSYKGNVEDLFVFSFRKEKGSALYVLKVKLFNQNIVVVKFYHKENGMVVMESSRLHPILYDLAYGYLKSNKDVEHIIFMGNLSEEVVQDEFLWDEIYHLKGIRTMFTKNAKWQSDFSGFIDKKKILNQLESENLGVGFLVHNKVNVEVVKERYYDHNVLEIVKGGKIKAQIFKKYRDMYSADYYLRREGNVSQDVLINFDNLEELVQSILEYMKDFELEEMVVGRNYQELFPELINLPEEEKEVLFNELLIITGEREEILSTELIRMARMVGKMLGFRLGVNLNRTNKQDSQRFEAYTYGMVLFEEEYLVYVIENQMTDEETFVGVIRGKNQENENEMIQKIKLKLMDWI